MQAEKGRRTDQKGCGRLRHRSHLPEDGDVIKDHRAAGGLRGVKIDGERFSGEIHAAELKSGGQHGEEVMILPAATAEEV